MTVLSLISDTSKVQKIISSLEVKIRPQELKSKDTKNLLNSICSQWLPISTATFRAIVSKIPDPITSQSIRLPKILYPDLNQADQITPSNPLERDLFLGRDSADSHVVIYVSKMFAVPTHELPQFQRRQLTAHEMREKGRQARVNLQAQSDQPKTESMESQSETTPRGPPTCLPLDTTRPASPNQLDASVPNDELSKSSTEPSIPAEEAESLIGFARIYSGTVRVNQILKCVLPRYNPKDPVSTQQGHIKDVQIENLYMIMGRSLTLVNEVKAGHVFGIGGLAGKVLRNATLCSSQPPSAPPTGEDSDVPDKNKSSNELDASSPLINLVGVRLAVIYVWLLNLPQLCFSY